MGASLWFYEIRQPAFERLVRTVQPGSHGARRASEHFRNLFVGKALGVTQHNGVDLILVCLEQGAEGVAFPAPASLHEFPIRSFQHHRRSPLACYDGHGLEFLRLILLPAWALRAYGSLEGCISTLPRSRFG